MEPRFFETPQQFRAWLEQNHEKESELLVGFYKTHTGKASITWPESVSEALCFGWIDGVRKSLGEESYTIRFTPRKPNSIWSTVNIRKMEELKEKRLVHPAGLAAYEKRKEEKSGIYGHEQKEELPLLPELEEQFKADKPAWEFFIKQAPYYKKVMINHINSAKQEKTRLARLEKLIAASRQGKRIQ